MRMNFIQSRLSVIDSFPFSYESIELSDKFVKNMFDIIDDILSKNPPLNVIDISLLEKDSVTSLLLGFDTNNSEVYVFWTSDSNANHNVGIKIPYHIFCKYYDDLWYPCSDDVWVYDTQNTFCIEISHEEIVTHRILRIADTII